MTTINEDGINGFDTRVQIRDPKTGRIVKEQNYSLTKTKSKDGNVVEYFERDGRKFWPSGKETSDKEISDVLGFDLNSPSVSRATMGEVSGMSRPTKKNIETAA